VAITKPCVRISGQLQSVASHTSQSDTPSLFILVATMGYYKQINNSNLLYVSDVVSLIIHERNYAISSMTCFPP